MADQSPELTNLIADARLVLAYAARSGRLPNKSLAEAIARASSGAADGTTEDRIMALTAALNESIRAIAPVTLIDLGSKWKPFPSSHPQMSRVTRIAFSIFAVLLVFATAYFTQLYSQANSILVAMHDVQSQNVIDKAERLLRFTVKNQQDIFPSDTTDKKDQDDVKFEPYLKYYEDLLRINDQIMTYYPLLESLISRAGNPMGIFSVWVKISSWLGCGGKKAEVPHSSLQGDAKDYKVEPITEVIKKVRDLLKEAEVPHSSLQGDAKDYKVEPITEVIKKKRDLLKAFTYHLGAGYLDLSMGNDDHTPPIPFWIYECQNVMAMLGIWLLPALYGLLGALVFQMRAILNPLIPDPSFERLLSRFSLGALAGIGMSWLFGSTPTKLLEGQSLNMTLFGVSFVFGFSIDIFFAFLDRTVDILSGSIAKMGH